MAHYHLSLSCVIVLLHATVISFIMLVICSIGDPRRVLIYSSDDLLNLILKTNFFSNS